MQRNFIKRADKNEHFWVNPNIVFNGSRISLVNEYVRKTEGELLSDSENQDELDDLLTT